MMPAPWQAEFFGTADNAGLAAALVDATCFMAMTDQPVIEVEVDLVEDCWRVTVVFRAT